MTIRHSNTAHMLLCLSLALPMLMLIRPLHNLICRPRQLVIRRVRFTRKQHTDAACRIAAVVRGCGGQPALVLPLSLSEYVACARVLIAETVPAVIALLARAGDALMDVMIPLPVS